MNKPLTPRQAAEAIEAFGDDLADLVKQFDRQCAYMSPFDERINAIPFQDQLEGVADHFRKLGEQLCREDDQHAEAEDRRRDSPLALDHRRLGQ